MVGLVIGPPPVNSRVWSLIISANPLIHPLVTLN